MFLNPLFDLELECTLVDGSRRAAIEDAGDAMCGYNYNVVNWERQVVHNGRTQVAIGGRVRVGSRAGGYEIREIAGARVFLILHVQVHSCTTQMRRKS